MSKRTRLSVLSVLSGSLFVALLTGCSGSFAPSEVTPAVVPIGNIQGSVHGGQAPVTGAWIYLFAAGTGGYGTSATSLITSGGPTVSCPSSATPAPANNGTYPLLQTACFTQTDSNGNFFLAGDYSCTQGQQVYMVALGGNPGAPTAVVTTGTYPTNSSTVTVLSATGINVGMTAVGSGVGGLVTAVTGKTVTLSQKTTAAGTGTPLTFQNQTTTATYSNNSSTITVASATGINTGMTAAGTGVAGFVTAVSGTTVTLSQKTTSAGTNATVMFSGVNNIGIIQMAALGQCPASGNLAAQVPFLVINEVTTAAFAYSVSGFATTPFNVSTSSTGTTALANAFANAGNIVNLQYGQAPTVANGNPNSINPQAKLYSLANILGTCVNQSSSTASQCTNLFKYAVNSSTPTTPATDEASAIFNIVHNQTQNVTNLYNLAPGAGVFSPTLSGAPTDWTMPVIYKNVVGSPSAGGGGSITTGPYNLVFDAKGNAWIGDRSLGVVELSPQGAVTNFTNAAYGFGMVKGVAVSPVDGSIWVSDFNNSDVYVMSSVGAHLTTLTQDMAATKTTTANGPILTAFALDPSTTGGYLAYEANETTAGIVTFSANTYALDHYNTNSYTNINTPGWISVDNNGSVWIPSTDTADIGGMATSYKNGAMAYTASQPGVVASYTTVADGNGNTWVAPNGTGTLALYQVTAGALAGSVTSTGGMNEPYKMVVDGNNVVWIANDGANTVSAYNTTSQKWLGAANVGFSTDAAGGTGCIVIGVDPSGNVWTGNSDNSVTQLLGLATPTAAPFYGGSTVINGTGRTAVTTYTSGNVGTTP